MELAGKLGTVFAFLEVADYELHVPILFFFLFDAVVYRLSINILIKKIGIYIAALKKTVLPQMAIRRDTGCSKFVEINKKIMFKFKNSDFHQCRTYRNEL